MVNPAAELSEVSAKGGPIKFEQPLTERTRTFLKIEFLYRQAVFHANNASEFGARAAVASLLEILTILSRGDVRAEVLKALDRHAALLGHFRRTPDIDSIRLNGLIDDIDGLKRELTAAGREFLIPLKQNDFLNTIKHRSGIPGGTCMFDLPDYGYWLHVPQDERAKQLEQWINQLKPLCDAVVEVLWLTREASEPIECVAYAGLYHHSLDRNEQYSLVRVLLPTPTGLYPEISAGQHRFTVRFVEWLGVDTRPRQVSEDVQFSLVLC